MSIIGTPYSKSRTKVMLCGSGELGKELVIELQRLGVEVVAVDRYENAPAMHVAHRAYVIDMLNGQQLREIIEKEKPEYIVPEIEAIATDTLVELEKEGFTVIPTAKATKLTMNREGIRRLAAEELGLKTSPYVFAESKDEFIKGIQKLGFPCVVKPIMSSSGKGQFILKNKEDIDKAWDYAQQGGRAGKGKVIVEGFIDFDYEITLLTIRYVDGTLFCEPIGHKQIDGDYRESWQPQNMHLDALLESKNIGKKITDALGGRGLFGVELFVKGDIIYFSEVSPRPHDTGMVTLISQELSEFALHARAILGLPIPRITQYGHSASCVILKNGNSKDISYGNLYEALNYANTQIRLFGKPEINGKRRLGVALARETDCKKARDLARTVSDKVVVSTN